MNRNEDFNVRVSHLPLKDRIEKYVFETDFHNGLNKQKLEKIFFNNLSDENIAYIHTLGKSGHKNDNIKYEYNSLNFRGKEFEFNEDMVIAGCSQTFGMGIEENLIWGNVVASHFGTKASNLSMPGASTESIVNNIFAYFKKYGHPKTLLGLFPDMYRFQIATDRKHITSSSIQNENSDGNWRPYLTYLYLDQMNQDKKPKYQKSPFNLEEILTPEIAFFHNIRSIIILNQYCDAVGIKFYWASWREELDMAMTKIKSESTEYDNYVPLKFGNWYTKYAVEEDPFGVERNLLSSCNYHKDYALDCENCYNNKECNKIVNCHDDLFNYNKDLFHYGNDRAHMGSHKHQHIAESFIERIKNEQNNI
jgi:hypothetical protein